MNTFSLNWTLGSGPIEQKLLYDIHDGAVPCLNGYTLGKNLCEAADSKK